MADADAFLSGLRDYHGFWSSFDRTNRSMHAAVLTAISHEADPTFAVSAVVAQAIHVAVMMSTVAVSAASH